MPPHAEAFATRLLRVHAMASATQPPVDPPSSATSSPTTPAVLAALRRLLRPAIRLAIRRGLMYPALAELLKEVYVDVAARDFVLADKAVTDSRVTLLTGVHRKDVRRLRETAQGLRAPAAPRAVSLGAQIVAAWSATPGCVDAEGRPKPLPRSGGADASTPSFDALVQSVSKDIRPRAVLDEWMRLGVVDVDADDVVTLRAEAFVPAEGFVEKTFYLGQNVHDHLAAAVHNLEGEGPAPLLERCVHYAHVPAAALPDLAALAESGGMKALRAVNARILGGDLPRRTGERDVRVNFGVYFFAEPMREDATDSGSTAGGDDDGR
jgi:hypothetical protein